MNDDDVKIIERLLYGEDDLELVPRPSGAYDLAEEAKAVQEGEERANELVREIITEFASGSTRPPRE